MDPINITVRSTGKSAKQLTVADLEPGTVFEYGEPFSTPSVRAVKLAGTHCANRPAVLLLTWSDGDTWFETICTNEIELATTAKVARVLGKLTELIVTPE